MPKRKCLDDVRSFAEPAEPVQKSKETETAQKTMLPTISISGGTNITINLSSN